MTILTWKMPGFIVALAGLGSLLPNAVSAQPQAAPSATIADNNSLLIDGENFTITPGRAKHDTSTLIKSLGARDLGPAAIVFRSGGRLYIVSTPMPLPSAYDHVGDNVNATVAQTDQPGRIKIQYAAPNSPDLQEIYGRAKDRRYLEKVQEILSPLRLPEPLTVKTAECGMLNAWYRREDSGPTVTICYELLKHISQSLPKQTTPSGITPTDAAAGQALWLVLHEVGHAAFDIFNVPLFGHEEDAADNFADYIMLQFGKDQARPLIGGAAWAWRAYVADYRTNPVIREQLAGFASNHGQPQERFYNLMCLAYGADPVTFAELTQDGFLPPSRSPNCKYEYKTLTKAFHREISPHIDQDMARQVLDTSWLPATESMPTAQK
jgi:hypothetical protein